MSIQLRWEREMLMMEVSASRGKGLVKLLKAVKMGLGESCLGFVGHLG